METNNCDESNSYCVVLTYSLTHFVHLGTQASVRGNESKVVPPTQNDLSHPQVVGTYNNYKKIMYDCKGTIKIILHVSLDFSRKENGGLVYLVCACAYITPERG